MGRDFPHENGLIEIHPFITLSLFFASVAATVAVVSSLCGALSRKRTPPSPVSEDPEMKEISVPISPRNDNDKDSFSPDHPPGDENGLGLSLPPPPGKRRMTGSASFHFRSSSVASTSSVSSQLKKLRSSLSMRAMGTGIGISSNKKNHDGRGSHRHHHDHSQKKNKEKKFNHEDSIWKKTIILGEKCRVPDEDDEDAILYDEKGNRIQAYHRKTTSFAMSRQNSLSRQNSSSIASDTIPSVEQGLKDEIRKNSLVGKN